MRYDPLTRILHLLIAVGVTSQMLTSLVMVYPKPGRLPNQWYEVHEWGGITLLALVGLYWVWALAKTVVHGQALLLFPWFSAQRIRDLAHDVADTIAHMRQGTLPPADRPSPLAGAVQGAGLLLALFLAGTGTSLAVGMAPNGALGPILHGVKEVHEGAAPLMWAYLVAHPLMGLLHQLAGHGSLSRMFMGR